MNRINKSELRALRTLLVVGDYGSTASVFDYLVRRGLAQRLGLVFSSLSSLGATLKAGYRITDAGRKALAESEGR